MHIFIRQLTVFVYWYMDCSKQQLFRVRVALMTYLSSPASGGAADDQAVPLHGLAGPRRPRHVRDRLLLQVCAARAHQSARAHRRPLQVSAGTRVYRFHCVVLLFWSSVVCCLDLGETRMYLGGRWCGSLHFH